MKKYQDASYTIYHGDALKVLQSEIASNSVDLVLEKNSLNLKIVAHQRQKSKIFWHLNKHKADFKV